MVADEVDDVPPVDDADVDSVVVVELAMLQQPLVKDRVAFELTPGVDAAGGPTGGVALEEFSSRSCCTCRMSTYSSRLAFGLVRLEIPDPYPLP